MHYAKIFNVFGKIVLEIRIVKKTQKCNQGKRFWTQTVQLFAGSDVLNLILLGNCSYYDAE